MAFVKRNIEIIIILLLGFILRFSISITHSYSNDELSAINRLRFDNFSDLIEFGVMKGDMHPAGVQVFMKIWSSIGGTSEAWMRFPFVLCGVASILLIFLMGLKWFKSKQVGLISASLLAVLYFPVMNSEFARPYSPGLLIILLLAWFLHKVLFSEEKKYRDAIILGVLFASAMYTHYFAFMFAGFIGFTGLFFLKKDNFKFYAIACVLGVLLFLPHYEVTKYHLNVGGLQWLGSPDKDWIIQFIFHVFNESFYLILMLLLFIIGSFLIPLKEFKIEKKYVYLCVLWFFGIYIVGHVYSLIGTPVLKFPVLLFALPFLLLLIGVILAKIRFQKLIVILILLIGTVSTVYEKDLYGNQHYGIFKEIAVEIIDWQEEFGEDNIYTVYNLSNPDYMNFYANQWDKEIDFDWDVIEFNDDMKIREDLINRQEDYCIVGYSARLTLPQVFETVKEFYPTIVEYKKFNNSAVFLMSRKKDNLESGKMLFGGFNFNGDLGESWNYENEGIHKSEIEEYYLLNESRNYGPEFIFLKSEIPMADSKYVRVEVDAEIPVDGELTITFSGTRNGEIIQYRRKNFWMGHDVENQINSKANGIGYYAFEIPSHIKNDDELKIGLWNRSALDIKVFSYRVYVLDNVWN